MSTRGSNRGGVDVGDKVLIIDQSRGESQEVLVQIIEIRHILGRHTYFVETQIGHRKLVGEAQICGIE